MLPCMALISPTAAVNWDREQWRTARPLRVPGSVPAWLCQGAAMGSGFGLPLGIPWGCPEQPHLPTQAGAEGSAGLGVTCSGTRRVHTAPEPKEGVTAGTAWCCASVSQAPGEDMRHVELCKEGKTSDTESPSKAALLLWTQPEGWQRWRWEQSCLAVQV